METIRVNMTPCEDVQTIHASQNDNEAREWGFELHNNGEKIDSSSISDQMVFKAYEGGTEELLPSSLMNGSVDLGSLAWTLYGANNHEFTAELPNMKVGTLNASIPSLGVNAVANYAQWTAQRPNDSLYKDSNGKLHLRLNPYTTVAELTSALQGVYLWFEKTDSTPTTTPFLGDIKYPQGLLTNQQFTYRESPTEEDGLANVVGIKGQTIKWNQLVQNGNFASTNGWTVYQPANASINANSNVLTETLTISTLTQGNAYTIGLQKTNVISDATHKYLCFVTITLSFTSNVRIELGGSAVVTTNPINANTKTTLSVVSTAYTYNKNLLIYPQSGVVGIDLSGQTLKYENIMLIDLTLMFGAGNEPTTVDEFKSLFPLDYYDLNIGSLLSFNGNGLKTVGKNLVSLALSPARQQRVAGVTIQSQTNEEFTITSTGSGTYANLGLYYNLKKGTYTLKFQAEASDSFAPIITVYDGNNSQVISNSVPRNTARTFTLTEDKIVEFRCFATTTSAVRTVRFYDFQLEFGSTATAYEPYTESVINLPISTYFPTGMNSVPKAYDELIPSKATQRVGRNLMQNLTWSMISSGVFGANLSNVPPSWTRGGTGVLLSPLYTEESWDSVDTSTYTDKSIHGLVFNNVLVLRVYDSSCTTLEQFTTKITDVPLLYELATPTETPFTTASLVTENAEIPLSNEDGVLIGECTEELSAEPGFHDAKIKLTDSDGDVYSNKIQLHVERSPQ